VEGEQESNELQTQKARPTNNQIRASKTKRKEKALN
jgi:hypothetical protein